MFLCKARHTLSHTHCTKQLLFNIQGHSGVCWDSSWGDMGREGVSVAFDYQEILLKREGKLSTTKIWERKEIARGETRGNFRLSKTFFDMLKR